MSITNFSVVAVALIVGLSTQRMVGVDNGHLSYDISGRGSPVLLIHGGLVDSRMWDGQMPALSKHHRLIRYDQRGFGRSSSVTKPYSPLRDIAQLLDEARISRAAIIGLSYGGQLAIDFALEYPARVSGLILAGATVRGVTLRQVGDRPRIYRALQNEGPEAAVRLWLDDPAFVTASSQPSVQARMRRMLLENVRGWGKLDPSLRMWPERNPADHLDSLVAPTLIIVGANDNPNILLTADLLSSNLPHASRLVIPSVGHHVNMEAPQEFNRAVSNFLERLRN